MSAVLAALPSVINERRRDMSYRNYLTDGVQAIAKNAATYLLPGIEDPLHYGVVLPLRWYEILHPKPAEQEKSGDEIAADVIKRAGLKVVRHEPV